MSKNYTYSRDKVDDRDIRFSTPLSTNSNATLPTIIDLRAKCPPIYNQGELGSCTANVGCAYRIMLEGNSETDLSRLFLYYAERNLAGNVNKDVGASLRDTCKTMYKTGICEEKYMPYNVDKFAKHPSKTAIMNAKNYKIKSYKSIGSLEEIKRVLAFEQKPVMMGMNVYESMESEVINETGMMPIPKTGEKSLGGHAVLVVGYKNITKTHGTIFKRKVHSGYLIVRNSWGSEWGDKGYFYMPYTYVKPEHTFDYWVLE